MAPEEKVCPDCAETVKAAARKCKHCGYEFAPAIQPIILPSKTAVPMAVVRTAPDELDGKLAEGEIAEVLSLLAERSLVVFDQGTGRYHLLETVRQYARDRLMEYGDGKVWRDRHLAHFVDMAEEAEPHLREAGQETWLAQLDSEHDNLRVALDWSEQNPELHALGLRLAGALHHFWFVRGPWSEGLSYLETALNRPAARGVTAARAKALNGAGSLSVKLNDYASARTFHEECLELRRELGDRRGIAASCGNLAIVSGEMGDIAESRQRFEQTLALFRDLEDRYGIAHSLLNLAHIALEIGEWEDARKLFEESLALSREAGDKFGMAGPLGGLGSLAVEQGEYDRARTLLQECIAVSRELGLVRGIAWAVSKLGIVALRQGDHEAARDLMLESLVLFRKLGARDGVAGELDALAHWNAETANGLRAARLWGAAEALREEICTSLSPVQYERHAREVEAARSAVGDDASFAAAWTEGRKMSLESAIALATT